MKMLKKIWEFVFSNRGKSPIKRMKELGIPARSGGYGYLVDDYNNLHELEPADENGVMAGKVLRRNFWGKS